MNIAIKDKAELSEMLKEASAKAIETEKRFAKKFYMTGDPVDAAKLNKVEAQKEVIKFFNALKSGDNATVAEISSKRAKALNEGTMAAGGYLVPQEFERTLIAAYDDFSEIRRDSRVVTMNSNVMNLNDLLGKVTVGKTAELVAITASQPTFGAPVLTTEKYTGSTTLSEELIEDSEIDVVTEIARMFGEQLAYAEQNSFVNSVVSNSEGLLKTSGTNDIALITGTTFSSLTFDDLAAMHKKAFQYNKGEANRGKFYMSMTAYNVLRTSKTAGDGNYFYMPAVPTTEAPATAWGRPIVVLNEFPGTTATATKFVLFGDLKNHFVIGDRRGMRIKVNTSGTSADGTNLNTQDARELVLTKRTAQVVALPAGLVTLKTN